MNAKKEKILRREMRKKANNLFTNLFSMVSYMKFHEKLGLCWKLLWYKKENKSC